MPRLPPPRHILTLPSLPLLDRSGKVRSGANLAVHWPYRECPFSGGERKSVGKVTSFRLAPKAVARYWGAQIGYGAPGKRTLENWKIRPQVELR